MKLPLRFSLPAALLAMLVAVPDAAFAARRNPSRVIPISDLSTYGINAACRVQRSGKVVLGKLNKKGKFSRGIKKRVRKARAKGLQKALRRAKRSCRALAREVDFRNQDTTPSQPTPAPQSPGAPTSSNPTNPSKPNSDTPRQPSTPVPSLAQWESQMQQWGDTHCRRLQDGTLRGDPALAATYYDAQWVFYRIADYTNDPRWLSCAQAAERVYRDEYVLPADGRVPGYWNFSHGLTRDYLSTGDEVSKRAALLLASNAAFAVDSTPLSSTQDVEQSREVAYAIMAYINAEDLGAAPRPRLQQLVEQAFGHMDQWFVSRTAGYMRPFMVALTSHALITYHQRTGDARVVPTLMHALDEVWNRTWLPHEQAFQYTDRNIDSGGVEAAPDLNLLIAPAYAYVYKETGEVRFRERADAAFVGGVNAAFLSNGKQFNQNYRWSFDYLTWRNAR